MNRKPVHSILIACWLCSGSASANTDGKSVDPADRVRYRAALKRGQSAYSNNDYQAAIAAFNEALAAIPGDARALSELGLAAYRKQDFAAAEASLRRSIAAAGDHDVKGASLYNLGRVLEDRGDKPGAIDAYRQSLGERPNATVRERLAGLDAAAAAALDPLAPRVLLGPFADLTQFCATARRAECRGEPGEGDSEYRCDGKPIRKLDAPAAPYRAVVLFNASCWFDPRHDYGLRKYHLAIRTKDGWFVARESPATWNNRRCDEALTVRGLELTDAVAGGAPEVVLRVERKGECTGGGGSETWTDQYLVVAGVGASGRPSATPPILTAEHRESSDFEDPPHVERVEAKLDVQFLDGQIDVEGTARHLDAKTRGELLGKHAFIFP